MSTSLSSTYGNRPRPNDQMEENIIAKESKALASLNVPGMLYAYLIRLLHDI